MHSVIAIGKRIQLGEVRLGDYIRPWAIKIDDWLHFP